MMNQVYNTLPDDRPITSLNVVEDIDKCPRGHTVISKTHDQDSDADLWKESGFFGRKCTRYLCLSKTEGFQGYVLESLVVINEKDMPPGGYRTIPKTSDTGQKAWRKKQLCCKFTHISSCQTAVTDIIILSRMKKAPEEFLLSGEINGMTLCYKTSKNISGNNMPMYPQVPYPVLSPPNEGNLNSNNSLYPNFNKSSGDIDTEKLRHNQERPLLPFRPAPKPPASYGTISGYNGLEGVPFILNPKFNFSNFSAKVFPMPKPKTKSQIDEEYEYEFRTERQT